MRTALLLCIAAASAMANAGERYIVDPRHSRPIFEVGHLGFSTQYGRFNDVRGSIELDADNGRGSIDITVEAASIDMGAAEWDEHMRGPDFFNTVEFPTIIFRSERIEFEGEKPVSAEGRLALLGIVRPLTLRIERFHCGLEVSTRRKKCGADATATIKRSDYGMTKYVPFVGDEVRLRIPVEAYPVADAAPSR